MAEGSKPKVVIDPNPKKVFTLLDGNGNVIGEGENIVQAVNKARAINQEAQDETDTN